MIMEKSLEGQQPPHPFLLPPDMDMAGQGGLLGLLIMV